MEAILSTLRLGWGGQALTVLSPSPGLAVDYHNERLYWADAKLSVIGSIRLNGTDPIVAADSKRGQNLVAVAVPSPVPNPDILPPKPEASLRCLPSFVTDPQQCCSTFQASPAGLPLNLPCRREAHPDPLAYLSIHWLGCTEAA